MTGVGSGVRRDPRHLQIAMLAALLAYGQGALGFGLRPEGVAVIFAGALGTQWALGRALQGAAFEPRSALISALSLCLLLRTDSLFWAAAAALLAVGSKFVIRRGDKHVFNPTNFGLVAVLLLTDRAWVSSGQWGSLATGAFALAGFGGLIVHRAERSDVTWAFLVFHAGLLFGRALWLGDPLAIPLHQLESGALLIFGFFMISDPRTTPDSRPGRVLFAAAVAGLAYVLRFHAWQPNALLLSLVACAPLVPVIDRLLPASRYQWPSRAEWGATPGEIADASSRTAPVGLLGRVAVRAAGSRTG